MAKRKFGVVLGGGGGRAFAHIGALMALEEAGLKPDMVAGASMGAVLGAVYAACPEANRIFPEVKDYFGNSPSFGKGKRQPSGDGLHRRPGFAGRLKKKFATASVAALMSFRKGLLKRHPLNRTIDELFAGKPENIEGLKLPFVCAALDIGAGRPVYFSSGPLTPALKAGVAVALVFAPFQWGERRYIDAAPLCAAPVAACRDIGAEVTLAVDLCAPLEEDPHIDTGFDVVRRLLAVESDILNRKELELADFVAKPMLDDVFWGDFGKIDQTIERGREAVIPHLPGLKAALAGEFTSPKAEER